VCGPPTARPSEVRASSGQLSCRCRRAGAYGPGSRFGVLHGEFGIMPAVEGLAHHAEPRVRVCDPQGHASEPKVRVSEKWTQVSAQNDALFQGGSIGPESGVHSPRPQFRVVLFRLRGRDALRGGRASRNAGRDHDDAGHPRRLRHGRRHPGHWGGGSRSTIRNTAESAPDRRCRQNDPPVSNPSPPKPPGCGNGDPPPKPESQGLGP
jgi:hypothetical protein